MKITETTLKGAFVVEPDRIEDERGFFARTFCRGEFDARGLNSNLVQCGVSFNRKRGTLRGMHYQVAPHAETKLVLCTRGAIYDVIIDLRPQSPTFRHWIAVDLSAENHLMVYIPEGFANGFQTLQPKRKSPIAFPNSIRPSMREESDGTIQRSQSTGRSRTRSFP